MGSSVYGPTLWRVCRRTMNLDSMEPLASSLKNEALVLGDFRAYTTTSTRARGTHLCSGGAASDSPQWRTRRQLGRSHLHRADTGPACRGVITDRYAMVDLHQLGPMLFGC